MPTFIILWPQHQVGDGQGHKLGIDQGILSF